MTDKPYSFILNIIQKDMHAPHIIQPRELQFNNHSEAVKWAKNNKHIHEGMVVWNIDENAEITYNGKPNRRACYKLKAKEEDDVVAYGYTEGSGSKQGKVGSLLIGKYNKEGEMVEMGSVGTGLKIKEGDCEIENWTFPCVIEIEYEQQFETGRYQFPVFIKKHGDKIPEEVVL
jgi:ATP-dependent DNA ligase